LRFLKVLINETKQLTPLKDPTTNIVAGLFRNSWPTAFGAVFFFHGFRYFLTYEVGQCQLSQQQ